MDKWVITDVESDEPILIYEGSFMDVMDFVNGRYEDEDGTVDVESYENWLNRQQKGKSMAKLTEGQEIYWRYLIDDNNDEAIVVEVEVVKDKSTEIEVEYEIVKQKGKYQ